jgi:hypothetical protein
LTFSSHRQFNRFLDASFRLLPLNDSSFSNFHTLNRYNGRTRGRHRRQREQHSRTHPKPGRSDNARTCESRPLNAQSLTIPSQRRIELPDEDLTATACFLEFLYKGDYFPSLSGSSLESDPEIPVPDTEGMALLRHARVCTLAQRFGVPALATLAHKKIHLTQSTARGEI